MLKPELPKLNKAQDDLIRLALAHFQVEEKPAYEMLTPSQKVMFYYLISGDKHRIQIIASTQYGKSLVVALACLFLSCIDGILVAVVAPSTDKAKIIMRYYIEHLGDHSRLLAKLQRDTKLDRLKKEESKERILLNNGGGIFVISAQERNAMKSIESAMGYGCFAYDEKIMTEKGEMPIGDFVKTKSKLKVACYNEQTKEVKYKAVKNWQTNKRKNRRMVKVHYNGGSFVCSEDHEVFVIEKGWVKAIDLKSVYKGLEVWGDWVWGDWTQPKLLGEVSFNKIEILKDTPEDIYNVEVEGEHNYFIN
jgi:hypothetical protein